MPKMRFRINVKRGIEPVTEIKGLENVIDMDHFTTGDAQQIPDVEAFLERLTGLRFHIEQMHEGE